MSFDDFTNEIKQKHQKKNPITEQKRENRKYKSIRINPEDHAALRRIAFFQDKTIVDVMEEATQLVKQKYEKET